MTMSTSNHEPATDPTVVVNIKLRKSLKTRLENYAAKRGLSASAAFRMFVTKGLDEADRHDPT